MRQTANSVYGWVACGAAAAGVVLFLGGCSGAREAFGLNKEAPDEFAVATRAPLALPPDYRLRPPAPDTKRPQERVLRDAAKEVVVGKARPPQTVAGLSRGESALLAHAGATGQVSAIRSKVDKESERLAEDSKSFVRRLMFWQKAPEPGEVVDSEKEARRIGNNLALGEPVTKGPVPSIKRRELGWFEGIF
jgi:hypothetical protein